MAKRESKDRKIAVGSGLAIPPIIKGSKYPWLDIVGDPDNKDAPAKHFFVECDTKEEAEKLKSSIHSSGVNFYLKRSMGLVPICRAMQIKEDGPWGVAAWSVVKEAN